MLCSGYELRLSAPVLLCSSASIFCTSRDAEEMWVYLVWVIMYLISLDLMYAVDLCLRDRIDLEELS